MKFFSRRCDVVYKTILRSFRRYILNDFNEFTHFKRRKRYRGHPFYQEEVLRYINERLDCPGLDVKTMFFYIGSLLYPKYLAGSPLWKDSRGNFSTGFCRHAADNEGFLNECLYNFSLERLEVLLKDEYVAMLFRFYAKMEANHIDAHKTMKLSTKSYQKAFAILRCHTEVHRQKLVSQLGMSYE